jgi:hypothetical protein
MLLIEIIAIIAFIVLLGAAIFMLVNFYVCDSHNCKAFNEAADKAPVDTKAYMIALMGELYNDGIWPIPYIGASILTPLSLWFIGIPITVRNFAIMFFVSFVTIYFMLTFFGHHYIRIISNYTIEYIRDSCPDNLNMDTTINTPVYNEDDENDNDEPICYKDSSNIVFESFTEGLDITFATPVNIF